MALHPGFTSSCSHYSHQLNTEGIMLNQFLTSTNYWAVAVAGLAYWILGAIWFSALFGDIWGTELEKHGVKIKEPSKRELLAKLVQTLVLNLIVVFGVSFVVFVAHSTTILSGLKLGLFTGFCFSASTIGIAYTWESRSLRLFFVDCGYPILGITMSAVILSLWS
jgi:hypothetical protein